MDCMLIKFGVDPENTTCIRVFWIGLQHSPVRLDSINALLIPSRSFHSWIFHRPIPGDPVLFTRSHLTSGPARRTSDEVVS